MMRIALFLLVAAALALPVLASDVVSLIPTHITTSYGKRIPLTLELVTTPEAREQGLMQRKTLAPHDGMAFFFPAIRPQKFWMKNTLIPLDILFVDEAGTIVYIAHATPLSLEAVGPQTAVATVIEIAGGRARNDGILIGDRVDYEIQTQPKHLAH